jgi:hypothetical protein
LLDAMLILWGSNVIRALLNGVVPVPLIASPSSRPLNRIETPLTLS